MEKKYFIKVKEDKTIISCLATATNLSKVKLKLALNYGSVQVKELKKTKFKKVRKATSLVHVGDEVRLYFNDALLSLSPLTHSKIIFENKDFGIWIKPSGYPSQGTEFGDHRSLLRFIEKNKKEAYLVHRLDYETEGLIIFAYNKKSAAYFSSLFSHHQIEKRYRAIVLDKKEELSAGSISTPLDGKEALTLYKVITRCGPQALVDIELKTGRYHQIRRHFEALGHPLMGDPKYGKNNKTQTGLMLICYELAFIPYSKNKLETFSLSPLEYPLFFPNL